MSYVRERDAALIREKVLARDHGICAMCQRDCERERKLAEAEGFRFSARKHFWEADHRTPVCEGGGGLGLENFRTLCISCHRYQTGQLTKRRVRRRAMGV